MAFDGMIMHFIYSLKMGVRTLLCIILQNDNKSKPYSFLKDIGSLVLIIAILEFEPWAITQGQLGQPVQGGDEMEHIYTIKFRVEILIQF